jgi:hypothetical protein
VIYRNPFQPFLAVDNEPVRSRQVEVFKPFAPFASRTELATKALDQAERDLEGARKRAEEADRKRERSAKRRPSPRGNESLLSWMPPSHVAIHASPRALHWKATRPQTSALPSWNNTSEKAPHAPSLTPVAGRGAKSLR